MLFQKKTHICLCFLACLLILGVPYLSAQATYGTIVGTVEDQTGGVVIGAKITIVNVDTNVSMSTTSNESGNYSISQLAPGRYTMNIEMAGFKKAVQQNIDVIVGRTMAVDAKLEIGTLSENVTVTAAPSGIETQRAEVTTTLQSSHFNELPVLDRNFTSLMLLSPGATLNTFQHASLENPQNSILVNTNGQQFSGANYLLDGMNNNDVVLGLAMVNPAIDSVSEVNIASSNYDAQFTQAGGAVIRVATKSGSNAVHGSAFEYLQNNVFQARDPFTQGLHDPGTPAPDHRGIPAMRWNQFGGTLGGPVIKDKLFWFGDYQGTRRRLGASTTLRLPTAAERTGDLGALGVPIYDPATGNPDGTGRQQFQGNIIPPDRISAPAQALFQVLPLPNLTPANPADNNYVTSTSGINDNDMFDVRVDHYITPKVNYFARYSFLDARINFPASLGLLGGQPFPTFNAEGKTDARNQNLVGSLFWAVSPTMLSEFRFGYSRYHVQENSGDAGLALADQVGIPGLNIPGRPDTFGLPDLNINGGSNGPAAPSVVGIGFQLGYRCNCPLDEREFVYDFLSHWSKTFKNHEFRWGGTYEFAGNRRLPSDNHRSGVYNFNPSTTALAPGNGGLGLASFILGLPFDFNRFAQISTTQEDRQNRMFYFAQDTWRVKSKLTLTLGLRWDTWFPDYSLNPGQGGRYDVITNTVFIPGVGGVSQSGNANPEWHNFSPRFGIAYALNSKTVLRTGFGRSYFQGTFGWTFNDLAADIYPSIVNQSLTAASSFQAVFPLTQAPPAAVFPVIPSNGMLILPDGISTPYIPANQKIPYVDQWNLTIEHQLPSQLNLAIGYVGNIGRHLNSGFNMNAAVPGPGDFNSRRPLFQQFGLTQGIFDKCDCSSSNYNALQIRAEKPMGSYYSLVAAYTYSRTMDFGAFGTPTNQYNMRGDYGPADFSRTHTFTVSHALQLPFGKGRRFWTDASGWREGFLGGWQFSGITTIYSGLPFSPSLSNNASLNSDMSLRPNKNGDPTAGVNQNRNQWFNASVYSVPAPFSFGNASRNSLVGPNLIVASWALDKTFNITESKHLQFRWEVFNVFNKTNLGQPNNAVDTAQAGVINDLNPSAPMRNMQFGMHFRF